MTFDTPTGRFQIQSKEENPVWVPPDWHYVEEARKKKLDLVRAKPGDVIDAETGEPVTSRASGVWSLLGEGERRPRRVLEVQKDSIVEVSPGRDRERGRAEGVHPHGQVSRRAAARLQAAPPREDPRAAYRLNLGDGYALHGTQATGQLGRSVSHGCVRLADDDLEKLYAMSDVGDEVIIY